MQQNDDMFCTNKIQQRGRVLRTQALQQMQQKGKFGQGRKTLHNNQKTKNKRQVKKNNTKL